MPELNERDTVITQYLHEAYMKEREGETALQNHINQTERAPYKKRLKQHLTETRQHSKAVHRRLKQLGAEDGILAETAHLAEVVVGAGKAVAKAPMEILGSTNPEEQMLSNARSEFRTENEEIALYKTIEALSEKVGDKETAKLARSIRREEERMAKYVDGQLQALARAVATERVPASQRSTNGSRSRSTTKRAGATKSSGATKRSGTTKSASAKRGSATKRATTAKRGTARTASKAKPKTRAKSASRSR